MLEKWRECIQKRSEIKWQKKEMANKYLALNIILWQNKNATVISMKSHEKKILYANMNGIYIFGECKQKFIQTKQQQNKSDTISKFGSSRTFMNSNRYEIANQWLEYYTKKKRRRKMYSGFSMEYSSVYSVNCIRAKCQKKRPCFWCTLMTFSLI